MATTWNPSDKSSFIDLSNSNTTATHTGDGGYDGVRGVTGYSTGLYYFEAIVPSSGGEGAVGVGSPSHALDASLGYGSVDSVGLYEDGTLWITYSGFAAIGGSSFVGARAGFLVNSSTRRLWVHASNGDWTHGGDPSGSGAGIDISTVTGDLFPMFTGRYIGDTSTIYSATETITLGLPTGATLWGADVVVIPPDPTAAHRPSRMVMWY
jgi:hypothetical protein